MSGCIKCGGTDLKLIKREPYTNYWQCNGCGHNFAKHELWIPDAKKSPSNVVKMIPPAKEPVEIPLVFQCGPKTVLPDITPYEAALLNLFILRAAGREPMRMEDVRTYSTGTLRHILIKDEAGELVRGDKVLTQIAEAAKS